MASHCSGDRLVDRRAVQIRRLLGHDERPVQARGAAEPADPQAGSTDLRERRQRDRALPQAGQRGQRVTGGPRGSAARRRGRPRPPTGHAVCATCRQRLAAAARERAARSGSERSGSCTGPGRHGGARARRAPRRRARQRHTAPRSAALPTAAAPAALPGRWAPPRGPDRRAPAASPRPAPAPAGIRWSRAPRRRGSRCRGRSSTRRVRRAQSWIPLGGRVLQARRARRGRPGRRQRP